MRRFVVVDETFRHTLRFLRDAIGFLSLAAAVVGVVVGVQGLQYLVRYSAGEVFGWAAAMSAVRDVGPLLLGFCLAARIGAKNAAELATMAHNETLTGLAALDIDLQRSVIAPRRNAIILVAALLFVPTASTVFLVACVLAKWLGGQRILTSLWSVHSYLKPQVLLDGAVRTVLIGVVIALCSTDLVSHLLLRREQGQTQSVGRVVFVATTWSMVGLCLVHVALTLFGAAA